MSFCGAPLYLSIAFLDEPILRARFDSWESGSVRIEEDAKTAVADAGRIPWRGLSAVVFFFVFDLGSVVVGVK